MTVFWTLAAVLLATALLFLLPPLLAPRASRTDSVSRDASNLDILREQLADVETELAAGTLGREQAEATRAELQRRMLEEVRGAGIATPVVVERSRVTAVIVGVAVPVCAVLIYLLVGSPRGLAPVEQQSAEGQGQGAAHEVTADQILAMTTRLAERLKEKPDDGAGWVMLARSYNAIGRFPDAAAAYAKAEKLFPGDAQLLADYADTLAMARDRNLQGEPLKLIERSLKIDPENVKALALAGTAAYEKREFSVAVNYWQRVLNLLPEDSDFKRSVQSSVDDARAQGGAALSQAGPGPRQQTAAAEAQKPAAVAARKEAPAVTAKDARVSGIAKLSPALAGKASPEDTLFVLARAATGPRMPLAIVRAKVRDLPLSFSLDDSMAMNESMKMSNFKDLVVVARVSKSGGATPQPGDLEGISQSVRLGASGVSVNITTEVK